MDFTDPRIVGTFLLHCHIASHEDQGMMSKIRIGTTPPLSTSGSSGITFASASAPKQTITLSGGAAPYSVNGCSGVVKATVSGSQVTLAPTGAGQCVLTVTDSSGLTANLVISVAAAAAALAVSPNSLAFSEPGAAPHSATISAGTPPYSVAGCTNLAAGSITGANLSVIPEAVGSCTLVVTDSASNTASVSVGVNAPPSGSVLDNDTFHQNSARQGWYQTEKQLTSANVASSSFGLLGTLSAPAGMPAFGKVYAHPLYASDESVAGTTHNLVIVATETDQVYAFDDVTDKVVWERNFTNAADGIRQQLATDTNCPNINPNIGITSTPVIDRLKDRMYVVVATYESGVFHMRLHSLSLQNGTDAVTPVEVSASTTLATGGVATTDPEYNSSRAALLEANGNIYVGLGSHCDYHSATTHGWLLAFSSSTLAPAGDAVDLTNSNNGTSSFLGSIWMSGYGPAADSSGNVYFATGNGIWDGLSSFAMSVLKLPANLDISAGSYFTPINELAESNADQDFSSGGVMLPPDGISSKYPHMLVAGGKWGAKYVLNRDLLGRQQAGDAGALWTQIIAGGTWGGPAYFQDSGGASYVIYGDGEPLYTFKMSPTTGALSVYAESVNVGCLECRDNGSQPIVSSNGTTPGTAVAWALKTPGSAGGTIYLYAFDALKMTTLFNGAAGVWTNASGQSNVGGALVSPLVANGRVYVPTDGAVAIFGLQP